MNAREELLKIVRCPIEHTPLHEADAELLDRLNRAIEQQRVIDRLGNPVTDPVPAALVNEGESWLYPVIDNIPCLIADEAIAVQPWQRPEPSPGTDDSTGPT